VRLEPDPTDLTALERGECLRLLGTTSVGRLGVCLRGLPWVVPVSFVFDGARILVDVGPDPALMRAVRDAVVAFEADDVDPDSHERWSVMATGIARPLHWSWHGGGDDHDCAADGHVVALEPEIIAGRLPALAR
jgi:nitroimidazol reductase NimA-like FMN-containing flavoprotein (pyridoxamine 5'-phosphate oxidase superfamily)